MEKIELPEEYPRKEWKIMQGVHMTQACVDNWENVDVFQVRSDDLFIASYPKSGTTWISEIVDMILNNGDVEKCKRDSIHNRVVMLELAGIKTMLPGTELLSKMPSPRLIKTHLPIQLLPKSFWENNCKIVYVARNAKDVAVSSYYFYSANKLHPHPGTMQEYLENFKAGRVSFGSWYDHVKGWWEKRMDLPILYLFYEDMKEDLRREILKVVGFLEKHLDNDVLEKIVRHASFDVMKDNPMTNYSLIPSILLDQSISPFMRKGVSGDWKNYFTVEQNNKFDEDYRKKMSGTTLCFRTEI
ncbi:sulfotransferase 1B1-like [Ascaphus truei]|uniref:sulfotransferase 1B1-like n=1 Tax=Ascaphus truei TaxID=8439 RepID=UPI003F59E00A